MPACAVTLTVYGFETDFRSRDKATKIFIACAVTLTVYGFETGELAKALGAPISTCAVTLTVYGFETISFR